MSGLRWLVDQYLQLPRWERLGNIVLLGILFILLALISFWPDPSISEDEKEKLNRMVADLERPQQNSAEVKKSYLTVSKVKDIHEDSSFLIPDLHSASQMDFVRAGLSKKVAKGLFNYLKKGGQIKGHNDVLKIYGMTPAMANAFTKHVVWDTLVNRKLDKKFYDGHKEFVVVDLNLADTTELKRVNGIGSKLASNIVKYRALIGQFHTVEQLIEVRGMFPENFEKVKSFVKVVDFKPFIQINLIEVKELKKHYYFRKNNLAEAIVAYREKHGAFKSMDDLLKCALVTPDILEKIKPYILL